MMRTTVNLDDDVVEAARALASAAHRSLGAEISRLARVGLRPAMARYAVEEGFPIFDVASDAPPITPSMVEAALDEW